MIDMEKKMYTFKAQTDTKAYDDFIESHGGWYIQSSRWIKVKTTWNCTCVCGFDDGVMVLADLVMERVLPAAGKIWYCSGGPVCDFGNTELLKSFTDYMRAQVKKHGVTAFIMDPPVSLRVNGEEQPSGHEMHRTLIDMGYVLNENTDEYTYKQPVLLSIPLKDADGKQLTAASILKRCDKGVRYSIRIGEKRGLVAATYTSEQVDADPSVMEDFISVMRDTSDRDDFVERNGDYCAKLLREFDGFSDLKLVYYDKELDRALEAQRQEEKKNALADLPGAHEKKARQINELIDSIDKQTEHFNKRIAEAEAFTDKNRICVAGGLSIYYAGMGSCLFGGTRNVIRNETRSSHYLNYLRLCESIDRGLDVHDLGYIIAKRPVIAEDGTLGPLEPKDNFKGIFDFKKSFSADYHEYIGEYVLVGSKLKYYAYTNLMPAAKKAKIAVIKKLRG